MTDHDDKVSVVIPVYNSEKFLKDSLESVFNQSYKNIEIIAINDGSTDKSLDIINQYAEKITIISQENQGLASALMHGIEKINGKWFKWFSPDDIMHPYTIETLVNEGKKYPDAIIYSNWDIIDESGNFLREFTESDYNTLSKFDYNVRLLDGQQINVNTSLIPSHLFKQIPFRDLDDPVVIDYDFFLRCALLCDVKFHLISKSLIKYRIHLDQLSHKNISKTLDYISNLKNDILMQLDESLRSRYVMQLEQYRKAKPVKKKMMDLGLRLLTVTPPCISDRILIFYLNKIRHGR